MYIFHHLLSSLVLAPPHFVLSEPPPDRGMVREGTPTQLVLGGAGVYTEVTPTSERK
jgi:hypothetical protein